MRDNFRMKVQCLKFWCIRHGAANTFGNDDLVYLFKSKKNNGMVNIGNFFLKTVECRVDGFQYNGNESRVSFDLFNEFLCKKLTG